MKIGLEMVAQCDARIEAYFDQPLPQKTLSRRRRSRSRASASMADVCKLATKSAARGCIIRIGERNKNALFLRMKSGCFADDPQPDLPACFANRERMKKLLSRIGEGNTPPAAAEEAAAAAYIAEKHVEND